MADFADGDGIFLGYETTQQGNDVVITNKVDLSDYGITDRVLKIRDPAKGSLTLKKEDAQTGEKLAGAIFRVEYTLFRNWDEKESFTDETLAAINWTAAANPTAATDANGTVTVAGLEPGIYKITEVTPPNGYKADPTPRYVVVTGGMRKTVTLNGKTLAEIPETFRNYSLAAQTQTSRGNPGHTQAAGTAASADAVIPQTGDASRPLVWVVLLALSGLALAGLTVCRKRKSRKPPLGGSHARERVLTPSRACFGRGNLRKKEAGPIKQIADHRRLCYTGNGLFPSGNHKQIRIKNDVLSNKTTYFPA